MLRSILKFGIRITRKQELILDDRITDGMVMELLLRRLLQMLRGMLLGVRHLKSYLIFCGTGVKVRFASRVRIGRWTILEDGVLLDGFGVHGVKIGRSCSIGAYSRLIASSNLKSLGEGIEISDGVGLGEFCRIGGSGGVFIGSNTIVAQYLSLHPENHVFDQPGILIKNQGVLRKPIRIGSNCWIGAKVTILSGVEVGDNCVIGAGSVVTKSFPRNSIIVGVPGRIVGQVPATSDEH